MEANVVEYRKDLDIEEGVRNMTTLEEAIKLAEEFRHKEVNFVEEYIVGNNN